MTDESGHKPSLRAVASSVGAAFFGVQSEKNRARDFQHGKPMQFIIIGLIATTIFILTLVGVVQLVLNLAGV